MFIVSQCVKSVFRLFEATQNLFTDFVIIPALPGLQPCGRISYNFHRITKPHRRILTPKAKAILTIMS